MAEVLENIHRGYAEELDRFDGDAAPFAKLNHELSRCLEHRYKEEARTRGFGFVYATAAILVLLVGGWLGWRAVQYSRWDHLVNTLREQPGFVITSFGRENGRFLVRGLHDPLAADPDQFIGGSSVNPADGDFRWGAYYALDDAIVQQRAKAILSPPPGAILSVQSGVLHLSGTAPSNWVRELLAKAPLVPGIRAVELAPGMQPEQLAFAETKNDIERAIVKFPLGSAALSSSELAALRRLAANVQLLLTAANHLHENTTLEVRGHTDSTGAETSNQNLSQRRADRVASELARLGIPERNLHAFGLGTTDPLRNEDTEDNRQLNRSANFRVVAIAH
jgi:OOP family OmpA-OmpF porin